MSAIAGRIAASVEPGPYAGLAALFRGDLSWQDRALCAQADPEAFFPEKSGSNREAKRVCQGCEVRAECLEYALENNETFGIWGGLSARERMTAGLDRKPRPAPVAAPSEPARPRSRRKAAEPERGADVEQPKPDDAVTRSETPVQAPTVEDEQPGERDALDLIDEEVARITDAHIENRLPETLRGAGAEPEPVPELAPAADPEPEPAPPVQAAVPAAPARRHRKCGYPIGSIGHEIACGGGK